MSLLSQSIAGVDLLDPFDTFGQPAPDSLLASYLGSAAYASPAPPVSSPFRNPSVNYADPQTDPGPIRGRPSDLLQLDSDPFGTVTARWAQTSGVDISDGSVMSLDVFGRRMSRDTLKQSDAGSRLLEIAERRRKGQKRGFLDAILFDWSWEDAPFVSLLATVGKSVSDAVTVSDTFKKLQDGLPVTDDELLKTRLYMAESEERENGTWGATVGDIMRAAPGFMTEFFATGGTYSLVRTGLAKLGKEGVHLGMTRATKILAREAMQEAAEKQVSKMAAKGAEGFVKLGADEAAKKSVIKEVADSVFRHTMKGNPLYEGLKDDVLESMAKSRAEYEFGKMLARNSGGKIANGLNTFTQWLGQNVSRGLMDFGAWGTEESTILFTGRSKATRALADAVGTFLVDAPLKGPLMWASNQFLARPLVGMALGQDGRTVSSAQLGLEASAYMTGNRELMSKAESMSHGLSLLEYVSENTGRGLTSLMRAAGIGLEKAGVKGLIRPATRALGVAEDTTDAVSLGGKMRQWVKSVFGSREGYRKQTTAAKVAAVARKVGATGDADMRAIETAVLSGSTDGLRAEIAEKVGPDIGKFAAAALKEMGDAERAELGYRTFGKFMVADWMARHQVGPETVMNMFDRMGYDGILGEMFEERYSDFAKGLFGWDDRTDHDVWSNLKTAIKNLYPGWDQLTAEAVAFAMPMVMRSGILRIQSAVAGGEGEIRKVQTRLAGIKDAFRVGTVTEMTPGEYMANHQRTVEQDEAEIARLDEERKRVQKGVDDAVQVGVDEAMADQRVQRSIEQRARRQGRKARQRALSAGRTAEQAAQDEQATYEAAKERAIARSRERYAEIERKRLTRPGGAAEQVSQLDADIARAKTVLERRKEMYDKFMASVPEAARQSAEEIVVPLYTADDLADDARYNRTPGLTAQQAGEAMAGRNAMVDYAPELGRRLVEAESRMEGEDPAWWRRAAHRLVGVAGALVTGDFSMAALNPVQWTARDLGLSRHVVDGLKKNMRESVVKAREILGEDHATVLARAGRIRGEADRARERGDEARAAQLEREAAAMEAAPANGRPTDKDVYDLAEKLAAPSAKRIMAMNLAVHHLRSFTKEQARDQAMGIVGKELGYEWYADKDGTLRFFKYKEGGREVDESTVVDAAAFYEANRERVDKTKKDLVAATVDVLSRRLTRSGDDSIRLLNAVSLPNPSELREMAQGREPGQMGPVSSDAVMREAALYDAAARMIGAGDLVERVRIDGSVPLAEVLDRGALGRVNMATVDYLSRFEKVEDVPDARAFEALAWSLSYPFDGTEKGLAERNRKLFAIAKLASHFNRDDKAFYSKPTAIDDEDASRLTPNGNIPLSATRVGDKWVVDMGRDKDGNPDTREFATREAMDAAMREDGYRPDMSRLVLTLAQAIESTDMFGMLRELGLAPRYRSLLTEANLHPMLRKDADGNYIDEDEAQRILRAELAAAEGGKTAPKGSRANTLWERVWGENGYMKIGERLLRDNGVEKSVVSKYAGEFSDYSPPVYTLQLSAGRLSPTSANVYVPIDPLVCPDIVSGVVNGLLIQSFLTHPHLLMNKMGGVLSEFVAQVRGVIDMVSAATEDKELKADLERFRREVAADVDKAVMTDEGLVYRKGAGMTASSYAVLASAFVLGRESDYAENPHLRAVATLAPYVRMCPAFTDFCDVVDLTLGGAGPISAASRIATGAEEDVADQRGLQRVMSFAAIDPKAMEKKLKEMRPLGLDPVKFLDLCARRLAALAKSGAPAVPEKEMQDLRDQASAAQANPTPKAHLTFYGHLIAVVKRILGTDVVIDPAVRDFIRDVAETAQDEPGVTEAQKDGLRKMLGMLTRVGVVGKAREKYENAVASYSKAFDETLDAYSRRQELKKVIDETSKAIASVKKEIARAEARNEAADMPVRWAARQDELADMQRKMTELKALRKRLWETETKARKAVETARTATEGAQTELRAAEGAGNTSDLAANNTVVAWMDRTLNAMAPAAEGAPEATDFDNKDQETDTEQDATDDGDEDLAAERTDAMELPESVALGEDKTVMSHGFTEVPVEMERSVRRLCVNVCVRSVAMRAVANADPNADPLETAVTEDSVVAMAKELFHLSDREADALRLQYRLADDARMRSNRTWEDFARSGVRWEFQEDDKADDDVSSDNFMNRAAAEYNSPFLADALALAARVAPESGTNLRAFIARTKEWLRRSEELDRSTPAMKFAMSLLDPRLDRRGETQAEQSALHMRALALFDESPETVAAHVASMLAPGESGKFPVSRRLAFLLSYMAALPVEDRRNFALLCANSVSAQATHVATEYVDGERVQFVAERRVGAGDKVSDRIVGDTFVHVLEGRDASEAQALADELRKRQAEILEQFPNSRYPGKVAGQIIGRVFGRESPLVTALASDAASEFRTRRVKNGDKAQQKLNKTLLESVTPVNGQVPIVESIAATLEALAARGEPLTSDNVTAAFVALFETGRPDQEVGVRRLENGPSITNPLKAWLSSYCESLPATIMSAEVDQRRDSSGSSVPIAPRDSVPMVSRWIYSDEKAKGVIDGRVVEFPTFEELARQAFPNATDAQIERCRQDACWPDGTPVCAKNTSSSLTTRELYLACEKAYQMHRGDAWYIPLYAGDHSSATMLRIPWSVKMDAFAKAGRPQQAKQEPLNVWYSTGENAEFSNLAERPFEYEGHRYVSVEHAYQTLKSGSFDEETYRQPWAAGKKFRGKPADTSKNVQLMRTLVAESFRQNPEAAAKLVATGSREFTHTQDKGVWAKEFPAALAAARASLSRPQKVKVAFTTDNRHRKKDEDKFNQFGGLTKFIGFGTGSTGAYAKTLAAIANQETYTADDIVGVSVNGKRPDRVPVRGTDVERLVRAATAAGATIIADEEKNRTDYNVGERDLAELLRELGYSDTNGNGVWRPTAQSTSAQLNDVPATDDPGRFADAAESLATVESEKTILSNEELAYWNEKGVGPFPRILTASEHTDPAFHVKEILDIINGKATVKDRNGKDTGLTGHDFAGLYLVTKHDGLPMKELLEAKIPKLIHFSVTTLGGTKYEPGVMKYGDLLDRIAEYLKMGLDPAAVTVRIDPIVPGVTKPSDIREVIRRCAEMGIKRVRFSVMDMYAGTAKHMAALGYDFAANGYRKVDSKTGMDLSGRTFHADPARLRGIAERVKAIADEYGITLGTCAEPLVVPGISREGCLSPAAVSNMLGTKVAESKSQQRALCGCFGGKTDALAWNHKCASHCVYCYARHDNEAAMRYYDKDGKLLDNAFTRTRGVPQAPVEQESAPSAPLGYRDAAKAMSYAVGMNLMYTDTKRSAVTSLENQGAGLIGVKDLGNLDEAAQKVAGTAAVGPDGKPLLLYHGSAGPIAAFENRNGYGTWFTNVRSQAVQFSWKAQGEPRRRSRNPSEWIPKQDLSKTNVQSFYLNIRNPKVYEPSTGTYGDAYYAFLKDFQEAPGAKGKNWDTPPDQAKKFADALKAQGYDGFVLRGTMVDDEVEDQWVAFDPQQIVEAKPPEYGEHRVHIIHNWAFEREGYTFNKAGKNEALLGTTRMYGYGARTMKTLSKDRKSDLLKLHLISTSGHDLFFIKSLSVAILEDENDGFLEGSMNGVIDSYARKFRGDDRNSTDTYTDDDSYKIGVGNSKAILVQTADGKTQKLKDWLFSRLRDACGAPKDASEDKVAAKFKSTYGKLTGDALDELVGDVQIVDLARTDGSEPTPMKLSELMPGVMVNAVEGLDGPCLDLSYREDGAMAYTVANVSHPSKVSNEPGRTPRNYEMDMIAAATMLSTFGVEPYTLADEVARDAYDLVANWGLVAACAYATKPQRDAAAARSVAVENLRLNGEHPDGQNIRSEVARAVWAQVRENANIPVKGVDAALVACGASVDDNNRLMAHTKSRMLRAMMRGAEIFTPEEQAFFGKRFRHALCNVNMSAPGFRHAWFLDRTRFDALDASHKAMTDREVATVLAAMFEEARKKAEDAKGAPKGPERKAAEAALLDAKKKLAGLFVDHHGIPIWSDDPSKSGHTEKYVKQFHLADLFGADGKFDMSALQLDGDKVHNDATGQEHILLGGTKFGFPRTPSYNAHYETVRAGLPVKEFRYVNADGQTRWRVSHDAMVSPDPYTNKILGTDHDGDKSKLYLLHTDAYGLADERVPPEPEGDGVLAGLAANSTVKVGNREVRARDAYVLQLSAGEWLERVWINPETGEEEPVPEGETPEGMYHRVSDRAKLAVSNAFVRTMFEISDSVPTLGMDGKERVSETPANRVKCLGGIAFRPVSTQPVLTEDAWDAIAANATAPVLGEREETRPDGTKVKVKETVGDPWKAAEVSTSAEDADGARGTIVALARTLHVAFASGQFSGLFGGQPTGMQWLAFLNHFDGLSNATFDDIKEQICGRLGWTKGMMDTVIVELLSSMDHLPTNDKEWSKILGDYARNVKEGRAEYWMLKASSVEEDEFVDQCRGILGVETLSKENLQAAMGVEYDANTGHWWPPPLKRQGPPPSDAPVGHKLKNLVNRIASAGARMYDNSNFKPAFDYIVEAVSRGLGHNAIVGRLAYLMSREATDKDLDSFARWAYKREQLDRAQEYERSINYLTADPGDASKFARYEPAVSAVVIGGDTVTDPTLVKLAIAQATGKFGVEVTYPAFAKMGIATGMMYRAAGNLATVEASAMLAAYRRDENLKELYKSDPEAARYLFVKDALPRWDRLGLTANRQQLPYLMSFFCRQASIAANVKDTLFTDANKLYGGVAAMATRVASYADPATKEPKYDAVGKGLAARVAIESLFSIMYKLMTTSTEFADGNTLPAYLRAPKDSEFDEKDYGKIGTRLLRIMPGYRSNDREAHERVRAMYDAIVRGEAYVKPRVGNWGNRDAEGTDCRRFSLSRKSLRAYMIEQLKPEHRQKFRLDKNLTLKHARDTEPERADVWDEIEDAGNALLALEKFLLGKPDPDKELAVTPAMMFGQLLPLYSLMTSRCLGAPDPSSPSILALAPSWLYEEISAGEAELSARVPELVNSVVAGNWAPYLENVRKTGKKLKRKDGKWQEVEVGVKDVDALAATADFSENDNGDIVLPKQPDATDAAEQRDNPDWRTTVDIFSDGAFKAALKAAGPSRAPAVPASAPAPGPAPRGAGAYDETTARVAGALGLALGTWATVEYAGGKTFVVRGKLRGTVGQGKNVVFTVDMDGKLCDTDRQVEALADSEAYGASLAECADIGIRSGQDFMRLPRDTRIALVKRYGVGGATMHHVDWKFDGKGVATLVGAIRLGKSKADTTVFHEYFHGMMRVFDAIGLFSEEDKAALRKTFGEPTKKGQWFNEERAAESFRKWVEGKTDPQARERRGVFRKIYDALKGILLAIRRGFGYTDDTDKNMELLFGFVAHGVAQASESKIGEIKAQAGSRASFARSTGAERSATRMDEAASALEAEYLARNDVAVATAIAQIVPPPAIENAEVSTETLVDVERKAVRRRETEIKPFDTGRPELQYQLDDDPAYDNVPQELRIRSGELTKELEAKLKDPSTQAADLKETLASLVDVRTEIARAMGQEILQVDEPLTLDTDTVGDQYLDFMPGSAESVVQDTRDAVKAVTTPVTETNDFYRAANFIHEAMEHGLESEGSWRAPLQDIVRRYGTPRWKSGVAENLDKAVLLHGLRNALEAVNPGASKMLDDQKLRDSLVFQAALSMYHGFDSWAHSRNKDAPPIPPEPGSDERSSEAIQYDVSGWILSTRPLSAAETIRQALDLTEAAMDRPDATGPVKAELKRHRDALRKVLDAVGDETGLMELRRGNLEAVFDEAFAMLREGTKLNGHSRDGRLNDITPGDVAELQAEGKTRALRRLDSFQNTHRVPMVQESLKSALEALWQTAAQAKFYRETDVVPATPEGMEFAAQMMLRHNAPNATPAEWAATQAIGGSNLVDNRPLVDFYCQPAFIANNVDAWLRSLVRDSFGARGNIGEMLSAENREYSAFKMRIADLENFYSLLMGTNVEDGGFLLKVEEVQGKWKMRHGEVVRESGETYLKIDNYRRKPTKIQLSEADLRVIDLYLKSITAYAVRQDRVVTGMDRLWFSPADFDHDWSREAIARKWNDGKPTAHMTPMEMTLMRLDTQFPPDVLDGAVDLRGRIVRKAEAELAAIRADAEARGEEPNPATVNRRVLRALRTAGLLETNGDTSFGVVTIPTDDLNRMFLGSEAYRKLTSEEGGRRPEWLDRDRIARDFMEVYRDAVRFARKHAWVMHGDGQYFNNFGTTLPFWRGDGVFMYNCNRVERDARQAAEDEMTATERALYRTMSEEDVDKPLHELDYAAYSELLDRTGEAYGVHAPGVRFAKDVADGKYEDGQELAERTKLVLPKDATKADLAHALYRKALEDVHLMATGAKSDGLRSAENIIRMYEDSKLERGELFAGTCGLNDLDVYKLHGVKPANAQIGHKVHLAIDGITNAMMHRATLANLLMTPAADGAPMYYADPSDYAADTSGLPDEFWANVARWWAEWNKIEYDAKLSGVQNAKRIYGMVHETRKRNQGKIGENEYARTYSELSGDDAKDCRTVERWLVRDDDRSFEESSVANAVAGGEAMGYLKQFVQAGRTLGFGGNMTRATLHRALSWSKSMSVAFSMFFPLATKWESPIGAVGATATIMSNMRKLGNFLREHPELANMMQKAVGGKGWITQNFLGFSDVIEMMDTNDPFLAEMKAWASALGVTLSTSLVNPMEETKSVMTEDLRWLKERIRDRMGAKAAAKFGRIVETVITRGGDKAFNYALNATKLAVVAQMCMKLRHAAQRKGKAFDPVRDLRRYSRYINAEVGGIDPLQYAWATPLNRGIMNTLMFSWQWTRGAWEAGGGGILEDLLLGGHNMTKEEREYIVGRWVRMFGTVMIGVPALMQCVVMALAKAMGGGDEDGDHWATWNNEDKTRWTAFDLTPLLKAIERFDDTKLGGILRSFKRDGAAATGLAGAAAGAILGRMNGGNMLTAGIGGLLGAVGGATLPTLVPMYTGEDQANRTSRARRYYMHFGKQGWEFFRWFEDAKGQFFSKLSMPTQRILEGIMGRNLSYLDRALPWDEMGQFERWLSPTTDGALFNLAQAFLPFSLGGVSRTGDAGGLPILGPVQMGASQTNIQDRLVKALTAWARNDRAGYRYGGASRTKSAKLLAERVGDILNDAKANGFDPESQLNKAYGQVATKLYGELIDLIPDDPKGDFDVRAVERTARAINRIGAKKAQVLKSLKARVEGRLKARGLSWRDLSAEDRARYAQAVTAGVGNPFGTYDY